MARKNATLVKLALAVVLAQAAFFHSVTYGQDRAEATRARILLALDSDAVSGGPTWLLDGQNMRAVLETTLKKQGVRYTVDFFTRKDVTPEGIVAYYKNLDTGPGETLLFYYSGHGGRDRKSGHHFLSFRRGRLYRPDLLAAMATKNPRLIVVLTDCCNNYAAGAWQEEPPHRVGRLSPANGRTYSKARRIEPTYLVKKLVPKKPRQNEDSPLLDPGQFQRQEGKAKKEEPPFQVRALPRGKGGAGTRARRQEPPFKEIGVILRTAAGPRTVPELMSRTNGVLMRNLLYRSRGVVDINASKKGTLSYGNKQWGGSFFTIAFISLQSGLIAKLDANKDGRVEWSEFFPALESYTERVSLRNTNGRLKQVPEAMRLGEK